MKRNLSLLILFVGITTSGFFAQALESIKETAPQTSIEFDETTFQWGELIEGEKIQNVFTFTNTGNEPLIISNAKGSCGCTVPRWPREPIMPGETADLLVEFNSKGKGKVEGANQSKRVTITANTDPVNTYLTIKGKVFKPEGDAEKTKSENRSADKSVDASQVLVYPNPTNGYVKISLKDFKETKALLEIYDGQGQKLQTQNVNDLGKELSFDVSQYAAGTYTVSVKVEGKNRLAKRFVVLAK